MMLPEKDKRIILDRVTEEDAIDLCRQLIRVPSPTGEEKEIAELIARKMDELGLDVQLVECERNRPNVIGTYRGEVEKPMVLFSAHMDTVPPGDLDKWITDPFGGEVIEGKIYGRGAMDSKGGGVAAMMTALKAVKDAGMRLKGSVMLVGTVGEEVADPAGMKYLVEEGYVRPDVAIYCVHSDLELKAYWKGIFWVKLTAKGQTAHGSMPHRGVNAIGNMIKILSRIEPKNLRYAKHPVLGDCTVNLGWIKTPEPRKYNVVADLCSAGVDIRLVPGQTCEGTKKEIESIIASLKKEDPQIDASIEVFNAEDPEELDPDSPLLKQVMEIAKEVLGRYPEVTGTIAAGDLAPLLTRGIPGVGFGPGDLERGNAHKENEFLELDQLIAATRVYALAMPILCGYVG